MSKCGTNLLGGAGEPWNICWIMNFFQVRLWLNLNRSNLFLSLFISFFVLTWTFFRFITDLTCSSYFCRVIKVFPQLHRIKISNRRATQRCNMSSFFLCKNMKFTCQKAEQPASTWVQHVCWPENVIDWLGKWRPTCVMRHAWGQKLQSFQCKWLFCMDFYSVTAATDFSPL